MKKTSLPEKYLKQLDETQLTDIENKIPDLHKDLHVFVEYVGNRTVKRSVRENRFPKPDLKRLTKLLSDPFAVRDVEEYGESDWLNFIDSLALKLKFIEYDINGDYAGYTSYNVSFPENYIEFNPKAYSTFMKKNLQEQEKIVFDTLVDSYAYNWNEFYSSSALGRLDRFQSWGCATGVMPYLHFGEARRKIFNHLKNYPPGIWYSIDSLIEQLKDLDPFFLIPRKPKYKHAYDKKKGRYCNFSERHAKSSLNINPNDPNAFEQVEGRYVERFLEYIPLCMGYVELAYGKNSQADTTPSLGRIKGFKVTERFIRFMKGSIPEPKVLVLPNHEIHIESETYPAGMINQLTPFASLVLEDKICIMKLDRQRIINFMAENDGFNLKKFLQGLSNIPLPPNIVTELSEWAGQSDMFVLYDTCGLLEGKSPPAIINDFVVKKISNDLCLIRSPEKVLEKLESKVRAPVEIKHRQAKLSMPPEGITGKYLKQKKKKPQKIVKEQLVLKRKTFVSLFFKKADVLEAFAKALVKGKCPFEVNKETLTLSYGSGDKKKVATALKDLRKTYQIKIEDLPS